MRGNNETIPVWSRVELPRNFSQLASDMKVDVCVIGAGITGLTTAYLLQKEGCSVAVLDAWGLAAGETGRTTAHLTAVLDDRFFDLESLFGEDKARLAAQSHRAAINTIHEIAQRERIDCDFEWVDGYLAALDDDQKKDFDKEKEAVTRAGFADMRILSALPLEQADLGPVMQFPRQACFHINKYMSGLAQAFLKAGGRIFTGVRVTDIHNDGRPFVKTEQGHIIAAGHIVVATNTPVNDRVTMHTKQAAYRTYVVAYEIPKDSYPGFLLWDMADPYHYVRIVRGDSTDYLIAGGEDHKTGQADDAEARYARIDQWTRQYFSGLGSIAYRWSGQIMEPVDSLAFLGRNPGGDKNVYIATGDSGNGMTHGTVAAMLITALILGRHNDWEDVYDPSRKPVRAAGTFLEENADVVAHLVKDWIAPGEVSNVEEIPNGQGAILRQGASKLAIYRDEAGALHVRSAVCTHLGCIVQWNGGEKSWDCPCHGSRFDTEGRVLNGPTTKALAEAQLK
jgi:glycine/D-amino acid oxidase-like deaminating enzyme/nitrite reductase/ring-hydroxylating ferredoxin subunit